MLAEQDDMSDPKAEQWKIGVEAWTICDGTDRDFHVGQVVDFAVVFHNPEPRGRPHPRLDRTYLEPSEKATIGAEAIEDGDYLINGRTVFAEGEGWVLDIGINVAARSKGPAPWATAGSFVSGRTFLTVDWDEVWHWHHLAPTAPPLVYTWRIEQILIWDDQIKAYSIEQERTDAWHESRQNMGTTYLLICTKLEVEPKRLTKRQVTTSEKLRDIKMKYGIEGRTREM